jgi:hypothetical protein
MRLTDFFDGHIQVAMLAAMQVAVVPERETQERQARSRFAELHHAGLLEGLSEACS